MRSAVERFEFCASPPGTYFLYITKPDAAALARGESGVATTWTGDRLGRVTFGREYRDSFGGRRVPIWIDAINGRRYAGTYFKSSGDYARVKLLKEKLTKRGVAFCDHTTPRAVAFCPYCRAKK